MGVAQKIRVYGYTTTLFFLFLIVSCEQALSQYYESINHPECSSPCWIGIEIGETSFDRAQERLTEKYGSRNLDSHYGESIEWNMHLSSGYVSFHQDKANDMFIFFGNDTDLTVDKLIDVLGEPEWVFVNSQPNIHCKYNRLDYPSLGIYGDLEMFGENEGVQESSKVVMLRFQSKIINEDLLVYDGYLVEWDGYKAYCD